jgi:hypothetical protein
MFMSLYAMLPPPGSRGGAHAQESGGQQRFPERKMDPKGADKEYEQENEASDDERHGFLDLYHGLFSWVTVFLAGMYFKFIREFGSWQAESRRTGRRE